MRIFSIIILQYILSMTVFAQTDNKNIESKINTGIIYSTEQISLKSYISDQTVLNYVTSVGNWVAATAKYPGEKFKFLVTNETKPKITSVSTGTLLLSRGLLQELSSEAELAAAISYGIAKFKFNSIVENYGLNSTSILLKAINYLEASGYDLYALGRVLHLVNKSSDANFINNKLMHYRSKRPSQVKSAIYKSKMQAIYGARQAFSQYQQAEEALYNKNNKLSLSFINEAIVAAPNEAIFYKLQGDIFLKEKEYQQALNSYDKAFNLDDKFHTLLLIRAIVHSKINSNEQALDNLIKYSQISNDYLP